MSLICFAVVSQTIYPVSVDNFFLGRMQLLALAALVVAAASAPTSPQKVTDLLSPFYFYRTQKVCFLSRPKRLLIS